MEEKLDVIMKTLIFMLEERPNYQRYSDYGTPEDAYLVETMEKLLHKEK